MNEQPDDRQRMADALLRGEAVCYGMRFELDADNALGIDSNLDWGFQKANVVRNMFVGFGGVRPTGVEGCTYFLPESEWTVVRDVKGRGWRVERKEST